MFKKSIRNTIILFIITILLFGVMVSANAASNYTTVIIKSNGGTDGVGRIEVGQPQMMIFSPAIPSPGRSITGYSFNGVKYFTTNGTYTNGKWSSADSTIIVTADTQVATKKCNKCSATMEYHSSNNTDCSWKHPENDCEYSNAVHSETHVWADATCVIKPYCKSCYTEKPGSSTSSTHTNLEIVAGTCSDNGGVIPHKHCAACDTYFTMSGSALANKNATIRKEKGHTWINEKWTWTVNSDNTASYVLHIECNNCGKVADYRNQSPVPVAQTAKTIKPTCTTDGANYYTTEIVYEGSTFVGEYTNVLPAPGHSFENEEKPKWTIAKDELDKQYHFHKCLNANCPDKGIVDAANCEATGENMATCDKASTCDVCEGTFGDILQHEYENAICKLCKHECKEHEWEIGTCKICTFVHEEHIWKDGICEECGFSSEEHEWENGVCKECQLKHEDHQWKDGACLVCLLSHDHKIWDNGVCQECHIAHEEHDWNKGQCKTCKFVHIEHEWDNGICVVCTMPCEHTMVGATCSICNFAEYKVFLSSQCVFHLESTGSVVFETNGPHDNFVALKINGNKVPKSDLALSDGRIVVMSSYLNNLPIGEHQVIIQYDNGEVSTSVIIMEAIKEESGGIGKIILIIALIALVAAIITGVVIFYIYRMRQDEYYDDDDEYYDDDEDDDPPPPPPSKPRTIAENVAARKAPQSQPQPQPQPQPRRYPQQITLTTEEEREILEKVNKEMQMDINKILNDE